MQFAIPGTSDSTGSICLGRGIRQGSAISPLLWVDGLAQYLTPLLAIWRLRGFGFKLGRLGQRRSQ
eukprot:13601045-Alexandrium_andersonii.AAC.1